jgi:hypothetical protein
MHGRAAEADRTLAAIEDGARSSGHALPAVDEATAVEIRPARRTGYLTVVVRLIFAGYWRRGVTAYLFDQGVLTALTQTIAWCVIFFFASSGASATHLTVSEIFPLEVRAQAIAVFFAIAQCLAPSARSSTAT